MADRVGQQMGNYRLLRLLGEGGFAEVYLGEQVHLGTSAAIKVLRARLKPEEIEQFRQEARTIALLKHPHIVRMLDFGVEGGAPYLVMEYAAGGTLRTLHPKGTQLPSEAIVAYVHQVASALQYTHDKHLVHRDVKPENMLLSESGEILLSDFGIALVAETTRHQRTRDTAGTIAYMAPEQIQGHPRPASDQYSLGIVVYEWLAGERPFTGTMSEVVAQHLGLPPPPLRDRLPNLPFALERVVFTALEKDPKARYTSVQAFATAFEQASLSQQPTVIRPTLPLPPPLPTVAAPLSATPGQVAPAEPLQEAARPSASWELAPTQITPPQPEENAARGESAAPPEPPLASTMRAATQSTLPSPLPVASRARRRWVRGLLVGVLVLVVVSGGLVGLSLADKGPSAVGNATPKPPPGIITEFALPTGDNPSDITAGPDGNLWFTKCILDSQGHCTNFKIGRITPGGRLTEFAVPTGCGNLYGCSPAGITAGPDGNLWFIEQDGNRIGRITPGGRLTEFAVPTAESEPVGITAGPDGNLWFTESGANQIRRITPLGSVTEFAVPTAGSYPGDITAGPDGNLWFSEFLGNKIGRITPGGRLTEFAVPTAESEPVGITAGPDGNLWFNEYEVHKIGRITPLGHITEFALPTGGSPRDITAGPDENLWFTEGVSDYSNTNSNIGRITSGR